MGVKGRRVALIEEISKTVISFQKGNENLYLNFKKGRNLKIFIYSTSRSQGTNAYCNWAYRRKHYSSKDIN